ncbi:MAG: ribosome biogenesis GTPase Der [Dehalococcoidia bacterium]|nr:ribosome biogenesis GTPase Der [Dehalococcoidia bacterium]
MTGPIVAIVGRTNVGKSTLLNRLAGRQLAVVADLPGTTRDRVFAFVSWQGRELTVVDTGGWQAKPQGSLEQKVKQQLEVAIAQADAIILLVDVKDGAIAADEEIAGVLRAANKPIILAVNKVDSDKQTSQVPDFYRLGIGEPVAISAHHNRGIDELMEAVLASLPAQPISIAEPGEAKLAIVGRPNVGKSTLLNALLGEERAIVHESPGTTRDSIDATINWGDKRIVLVDTAGIKRRGRVGVGVDYYSLLRALQAINRCDVALLLIDASEFITAQDMHIAGYIIDAGKGVMLLVNKWDLVAQEQRERFKQSLGQRLRFASYAPVIYISAKSGQGIDGILPLAWEIWQERQKQIARTAVDELVKQVVSKHPAPRTGSRRLHIVRAYQDESQPATFILEVNDPKLVHFSYQRYLDNRLRQGFGFRGVPVKVIFTKAARKINKKINVTAQ